MVDELERKDELLVQLMSENLTRDTATIQDMDEQLATLQGTLPIFSAFSIITVIYFTSQLNWPC